MQITDKQEAIKRIADYMRVHEIGEYPHVKLEEALNMEISALREQQTTLGGTYVSIEWFNAVKAELDVLKAKQAANLDRSRFGWCRYCDGGQGVVTFEVPDEIDVPEDAVKFEWIEIPRYCPICGKPQTDEAWAELEGRINGGTTDDA